MEHLVNFGNVPDHRRRAARDLEEIRPSESTVLRHLNEVDHACLIEAIRSGRVTAVSGI